MDLRHQTERRSPEQMVSHLNSFNLDLKFSAGVWFFSPGGSRFHGRYVPDLPMEARLEIAAGLKDYGLAGLEAHYPSELNEDNLDLWKSFIRDTGIRLVGLAANIFYDPQYEWGALSSPLPEARKSAIARTETTLRLVKELDADVAIVWPGIDGYENPFGMDLIATRDRFAEGLAEAMDAVPGVPVAEEPKPYEPRGRILYGTTAEGILLAQKVEGLLRNPENRAKLEAGETLVGLNPEVGHILMGFEDLPYAFSLVLEYGKLMHTHWNSQPLGNYDQDLNAGVISPEQMEAALYVLKMHGYRGYFGIDINPLRMPTAQALRNNMDAIRAANDRINSLDHEKVIFATSHPDQAWGWLEAYLIRMRAPSASDLHPLPDPQQM